MRLVCTKVRPGARRVEHQGPDILAVLPPIAGALAASVFRGEAMHKEERLALSE